MKKYISVGLSLILASVAWYYLGTRMGEVDESKIQWQRDMMERERRHAQE